MANPPSFSPRRKWAIILQVGLVLILVLAVVTMLNYLSRDYFIRFHLSTSTKNPLSSRTVNLLKTITNEVKVIIYYDKQGEDLYSSIADLLHEYTLANPKISVQTIDYIRDAGAALQLKEKYPFLASAAAKNLVIFDSNGHVKPIEGNALAQYVLEQVPNEKEREFRKKPTAFLGETMFSAAILDVTSPRRLKACFLQGHGEHDPASGEENSGFQKFASILQQNFFQIEGLSLVGTNTVPLDCSLLVIAGPTAAIPQPELDRVSQYLTEGGRLLVLFNFLSASKSVGLEPILQDWGVRVGNLVVKDPENTLTGSDVIVSRFGKHPVVSPLLQLRLHLIMPRAIQKVESGAKVADAPTVTEIAFSGPKSFLTGTAGTNPASYPLIATVEKAPPRGVITERGATRILVAGDSLFLANRQIDSAANRDFAGHAANWLLNRTELLSGVGPKPITEYKLIMTDRQLRGSQWVLLGAMPGSVLLLGALVWFRRRK
jgi:hypothetical protein